MKVQSPFPEDIKTLIKRELSPREVSRIDMRVLGNLIYHTTFSLSRRVTSELLAPMSRWLDDTDWLGKFTVCEDRTPNWAAYKKRQRNVSARQTYLAAERLKCYWQAVRKKKALRADLGKVIGRKSSTARFSIPLKQQFITPLIAPFSVSEQHKEETRQQFWHARSLSVSARLPWSVLIESELKISQKLQDLQVYFPEYPKKDMASKLIHLLQMEMDGKITLRQTVPFGDIMIHPLDSHTDKELSIKDEQGRSYHFNWHKLNDVQRTKIITDIKENRILCKVTEQ